MFNLFRRKTSQESDQEHKMVEYWTPYGEVRWDTWTGEIAIPDVPGFVIDWPDGIYPNRGPKVQARALAQMLFQYHYNNIVIRHINTVIKRYPMRGPPSEAQNEERRS